MRINGHRMKDKGKSRIPSHDAGWSLGVWAPPSSPIPSCRAGHHACLAGCEMAAMCEFCPWFNAANLLKSADNPKIYTHFLVLYKGFR